MAAPGGEPVQALLARTWHLARLMLADQPDVGDLMLAGEDVRIPDDPATGRFVLSLGAPGESVYVVADHGTRTTRTELPDWATEADVHVVELAERRGAAWELLATAAEALRAMDHVVYDDMRVGETLDAVESYGREGEFASQAHAAGFVALPRDQVDSLLGESDAAERWGRERIASVRREFGLLRLPIDPADKALATLALILKLADSRRALAAGLLRTIRPDLGQETVTELAAQPDAVTQLAAQYPFPQAVFGLMLEPGFYALELELAGLGGLRTAWHAGADLEARGDQSLDRARGVSSIELFYLSLADALLHYRAADTLYAFLEEFYRSTGKDLPVLNARRVLCEERRVTLVGSFYHATGFSPRLNPASFTSIRSWIRELAARPLGEAEAVVHDFALRLVLPTFLRDLVLGGVLRTAGAIEAARDALTRVYELLLRDRERNARVPAEPNFLVLAGEELAAAHDALGDRKAAARVRSRAAGEASDARSDARDHQAK